MPRFSVKDLLIGTTLVAAGMTLLMMITREPGVWVKIPLLFVGFALIGAGFGAPCGRHWLGAALWVGVLLLGLLGVIVANIIDLY